MPFLFFYRGICHRGSVRPGRHVPRDAFSETQLEFRDPPAEKHESSKYNA